MSHLVYVQGVPSESVRYYSSEPLNSTPMQQMTFLYPSPGGMQAVSTPPQQQQPPQQLPVPNGTPYYVCQNRVLDMSNANANQGNKVVYLVPSLPSNNAGPMSMVIHSNNSISSNLPMNQPYGGQQMYPTAQMVPQQQQQQQQYPPMAYAPMPNMMPIKAPQPTMDPNTKLTLLRSPDVCRHYLNGRCNRRKCRFLHPDRLSSVEPSNVSYIAAEPPTPLHSQAAHSGAQIGSYHNSMSASMNSISMMGGPMGWSGARAQ